MRPLSSKLTVVVISSLLASCAAVPNAGPSYHAIEGQAAVKLSTKDKKVGIDYVLIDINKSILGYFQSETVSSLKDGFGGGRGGAPTIPLGVGDAVEVSIFEAQAGGLFIPSDAGSRPGNFITLPAQQIDSNGSISVPYAGRIRAAGRAKEQVEREIEDLLANRAIEPQVVITVTERKSSQVAVLGDVNDPQKVEISSGGERVLDVISTAGGISAPGIETYITLQRNGRHGDDFLQQAVQLAGREHLCRPGRHDLRQPRAPHLPGLRRVRCKRSLRLRRIGTVAGRSARQVGRSPG